MKPVIGVVADVHAHAKHIPHCVQQKYLEAVTAGAHAIAIILPALIPTEGAAWTDPDDFAHILSTLDGLFLPGATSNVAPPLYGATLADPASPADPARDHVSLNLIHAAIDLGLPILGVCRGHQELNVALGGTLHQSIHTTPGLADHRERPTDPLHLQYAPAHDVTFTPGGLLASITKTTHARVNSIHGQGIDQLAPLLAADATAPDGLIEAIRLDRGSQFLLGVQWHPEWEFRADPVSTAIFHAFGTAARTYRLHRTARLRTPERA